MLFEVLHGANVVDLVVVCQQSEAISPDLRDHQGGHDGFFNDHQSPSSPSWSSSHLSSGQVLADNVGAWDVDHVQTAENILLQFWKYGYDSDYDSDYDNYV